MKTLFAAVLVILVSGSVSLSAPALAAERAVVHHVAPAEAAERQPLTLGAAVEHAWTEKALVARYRSPGAPAWTDVTFERSSTGAFIAVIPAEAVVRPGVEYYVVGLAEGGGEVAHYASAAAPHEVRVEPPTELRWIEAEERRLAGRVDRVQLGGEIVDFGDELGDRDYYTRAEIAWTHRVVSTLYSFSLGYGYVEGQTPVVRGEDQPLAARGARYGFGSVRLRLHDKLWADAGVSLGFSHAGFAPGLRGQVIIGRPWQACVVLGAESVVDLGSTMWVELQWDTVPPLLMRARVTSTELPGSALEGGAQVALFADYPLGERVTLGAHLSANARERRPAHLGGGATLSLDF